MKQSIKRKALWAVIGYSVAFVVLLYATSWYMAGPRGGEWYAVPTAFLLLLFTALSACATIAKIIIYTESE